MAAIAPSSRQASLSRWLTPLASAALLVGAPLLAQASTQTLSGTYLDVSYDTANLPAAFGNVQITTSDLAWDCSASACSLAGSPTVSLTFGSSTGAPVSVTTLNTMLSFSTAVTAGTTVLDPLGNSWAISANKFGWNFGVDIAGQQAPTNAQFATALGQVQSMVAVMPQDAAGTALVMPWGAQPSWNGAFSGSVTFAGVPTYLNVGQAGLINFGPGSADPIPPTAQQDGDRINEVWQFGNNLQSAYYALPSITDPQCSSMSCMRFAYGSTQVNGYTFQMALNATAVPEVGTSTLTLMGLGLVAIGLRRRGTQA